MDSFHEKRGYHIILVLVVVLGFLFQTAEAEDDELPSGATADARR